jgi:signal transduction histidine kinase
MQGVLDLDRLLYTILTCVTAGTALGFNRAILLLIDRSRNVLDGRMGVGPSSQEDVARIWSELALRNPTVEDILADYDRLEDPAQTPLSRAARQIRVALDDPDDVLVQAVRERRTFTATDGESLVISPALWSALGTHHFVAVPLVVKDRVLGVIVADNLYSGAPITDESVDLLSALASQAALALDNAELYRQLEAKVQEVEKAYRELERTQKELVLSERLAVVGEMSARMAHEIRNPMATIGGFARSILKKPEPERVKTAGRIILEETERLETLLEDTLSFTRPNKPQVVPTDLNQLFRDIHALIDEDLENNEVVYHERLSPDLPVLNVDAAQAKQVFINLLQNSLQAMPSGGDLTVSTRPCQLPAHPRAGGTEHVGVEIEIHDTGEGIPAEHLEQIFSPFFTTKTYGTGLGLAISKKIVEDHAGALTIKSQQGKGTTVRIQLPSQFPQPEGQSHENPPDC